MRSSTSLAAAIMAVGLIATTSLIVGCGATPPPEPEAPAHDPLEDASTEQLVAAGRLLESRADYVRAEQYYRASLERGADEDEVVPALIRVCVQASRLRAALEYAEPYLARHPDNWSLHTLVGTIYFGLLDGPSAARSFEQATRVAPEQPVPHFRFGEVSREMLSDDEGAKSSFQRYLELAPDGEYANQAANYIADIERGAAPGDDRRFVRLRPPSESSAAPPGEGADAAAGGSESAAPGSAADSAPVSAPPSDSATLEPATSDAAASDAAAPEPAPSGSGASDSSGPSNGTVDLSVIR